MLAVWVDRYVELPEDEQRVLTFSPDYHPGDPMRYRVVTGQFVALCTEVTHWLDLESISPE